MPDLPHCYLVEFLVGIYTWHDQLFNLSVSIKGKGPVKAALSPQ